MNRRDAKNAEKRKGTSEETFTENTPACSRREFIGRAALGAAAFAFGPELAASAAEKPGSPIVVFSKVYQTLELNYEDAAAVTAEAGLTGIDCPVRPGGEVLPERVTDELPRYVEALRRWNLQMPLLTTAITSVMSPQAEALLRTARKLGIQFYRLGFVDKQKDVPIEKQAGEIRPQLKDLAALNKEIGVCGLLQNHSPAGHGLYFGGDLAEMELLLDGFDPSQLGLAFDIGHALVVHGDGWRPHFEKLKTHFKIAYVKDVTRTARWVPFGEGDVAGTGYFKLLRELGYHAPISMHIEFDWTHGGTTKSRPVLVKALSESAGVLRRWVET
jgi:sugar phosphate isomerase/epimerase